MAAVTFAAASSVMRVIWTLMSTEQKRHQQINVYRRLHCCWSISLRWHTTMAMLGSHIVLLEHTLHTTQYSIIRRLHMPVLGVQGACSGVMRHSFAS
jgi:hypothetical protein